MNWDLSQIYSTEEAWETARSDLVSKKGTMDRFKGRLGSDASTLKAALQGRRELFEGLALADVSHEWAAYPVIHIDLGDRQAG